MAKHACSAKALAEIDDIVTLSKRRNVMKNRQIRLDVLDTAVRECIRDKKFEMAQQLNKRAQKLRLTIVPVPTTTFTDDVF